MTAEGSGESPAPPRQPVEAPAGRLVVGLVRGLQGLRGALRVEVLTDEPERFAVGAVLHREASDDPLTLVWTQHDGPGLLVRFREIRTREHAETLRDVYLEASVDEAARPEGTYYWHEVIGVGVSTETGETLGTVHDVFRAGGGEVFVVRGGPRGEVLVPAVRGFVSELSPRAGRIVVDGGALGLDPAAHRRADGEDAIAGQEDATAAEEDAASGP